MELTRLNAIAADRYAMTRIACRRLSGVSGVLGGCILVALAAQVRVPVPGTDVPMTLQSLAVLLTGMALSPPRAVSALLLYLALGTIGLPLFAAGSAGLLGFTGGYLIGFVVAAGVVSALKGSSSGYWGLVGLVAAGTAGTLVIFSCGVAWRILWFGGDVGAALATGLVPFAFKTFVEIVLAAVFAVSLRGRRLNAGGIRRCDMAEVS